MFRRSSHKAVNRNSKGQEEKRSKKVVLREHGELLVAGGMVNRVEGFRLVWFVNVKGRRELSHKTLPSIQYHRSDGFGLRSFLVP